MTTRNTIEENDGMGIDTKHINKTLTLTSRAPKEASVNFWGAASPTGRLVHVLSG